DDRTGGAGPRRAQKRDLARSQNRRRRYSSEPCHRLAQARSAARRRHARRRRRHGMIWARPAGGRKRGAERSSTSLLERRKSFQSQSSVRASSGGREPASPASVAAPTTRAWRNFVAGENSISDHHIDLGCSAACSRSAEQFVLPSSNVGNLATPAIDLMAAGT